MPTFIAETLARQVAPFATPGWSDLRGVLPALVLFGTGTLVLGVELVLRRRADAVADRGVLHFLALLGTGAAGALVVAAQQSGSVTTHFFGAVRVDPFTCAASLVILLGTFGSLLAATDSLRRLGIECGEFHGLVLYAAGAMLLFVSSDHLLTAFLSLEVLSLAAYLVTAFQRDVRRSVEGGMKYFILGGFSTGFLLLGLVFIYGATGELALPAIVASVRDTAGPQGSRADLPLLFGGMALALVGLSFKVGAFPFHSWLPDAYEGAPAVATGFMAVTVKTAAFAVLLRLVVGLVPAGATESAAGTLTTAIGAIAAATMVFGNVVALVQRSVKRMLAYSAIAHTGYLFVGLLAAASPPAGDPGVVREASAAVLFYLLPYALMSLAAFTLLGSAGRGGEDRESFEDYRGFAAEQPLLAFALLVVLVSFAGIPPTAGFWAKLQIFRVALASGHWMLALLGVLTSIVSLGYYLRLVVNFYMRPAASPAIETRAEVGRETNQTASAIVIGGAAVAIVLLGLFPGPALEVAAVSAEFLAGTRP